jgi:aspartyl-tRNA synthetase
MLRTHTCGELSRDDINKEVTLCGWVAARRDHGKLIFIDVRDRYGITQVVFLPKPDAALYEKAKALRSEDVIKVKGTVNPRPKNTENPKLATGFIEMLAKELEIINPSLELPFLIDDNIEVGEETKLFHRYLDLRRKKSLKKIVLRHNFNQAIRSFLNREGFIEVETPFLTKSTPEGARDFLVPSRLNPNKFYALPQSPQLFKQILMVAGLDKYYQIVRCFRDEDLRKDRQPEFTQLDLEMSFVDEEDIMALVERFIAYAFSEVLAEEIKAPFPRISYK